MSSCNAAKQYISTETASLLVLALLTDDVLRLKASRKEGKEGHSKMYEWLLGHWTADMINVVWACEAGLFTATFTFSFYLLSCYMV